MAAIENGLRTVAGRSLREAMAKWIVDEIVPVSRLVPESYIKWRPPVRDAMTFVVARLSPGRLAPKLLEQLELARNTSPETRLLRLIAKVPGLQRLIPEYFAEDMDYLQRLAEYFGGQHHTYGFPPHLIPDTFEKVRRLLRHEVNFRREQKTLLEAAHLYRNLAGVRVPGVIRALCSDRITALTQELGLKITSAVAKLPGDRKQLVAQQLVEALVAHPLLSAQENVIFHGDPHAGNILYDRRIGQMTIIDWALQEHLSRDQRRHLMLLFAMLVKKNSATSEISIDSSSNFNCARLVSD